ncbi:P-loop NTPase fold protein [Falsiroseomonas oryzae]|uniref:P-loop NTPase fold protein n=1 Tax=Falsiroseomonas oryzae TaxID=2766473 RepID=UPI0022EA157B|nr:P-loop NTPase fold protein [Roseomonas sp. MO-31]
MLRDAAIGARGMQRIPGREGVALLREGPPEGSGTGAGLERGTMVWLGQHGGVRVDVGYGLDVWTLPADALVLPTGPRGALSGGLVRRIEEVAGAKREALRARLQEANLRSGYGADSPALVRCDDLGIDGLAPRSLILATAFVAGTHRDPGRAMQGIIRLCAERGVASLVQPMLGSGDGGGDPIETARQMLYVIGEPGLSASHRLRSIVLATLSPEAFWTLLEMQADPTMLPGPMGRRPGEDWYTRMTAIRCFASRPGLRGRAVVTPLSLTLALGETALDRGAGIEARPALAGGEGGGLPLGPLAWSLAECMRTQAEGWRKLRDHVLRGAQPEPVEICVASAAADLIENAINRAEPGNEVGLEQLVAAVLGDTVPGLRGELAAFGVELPPPPSAASSPTQRAPFRPAIAGILSDNPGAASVQDCLGVGDEAAAFARLISARQVSPPIAIGVFGHWGTGKSFFLRLLHEKVAECAALAMQAPEDARAAHPFHDGIVQIRFNAWHYVDTNLWASLVTHIFGELDRWTRDREGGAKTDSADQLFERLATSRSLSLDAARALVRRREELRHATAQLAQAEADLAKARAQAKPDMAAITAAAWQGLQAAKPELLAAAKDALEKLGVPAAGAEAERLRQSAAALTRGGADAFARLGRLSRQFGSPAGVLVALACAAVIPVCVAFLAQRLTGLGDAATAVTLFGGLCAGGASAAAWAHRQVQGALGRLATFQDALEAEIAQRVSDGDARQAAEAQSLAAAKEAEARALLAATTERAAEAARQFDAGTGRSRLYRFVRERAAAEEYRRHVGLVAAVRRDFEELAFAMDAARRDAEVEARAKRNREAHAQEVEALLAQAGDLLDAKERAKLQEGVQAAEQPPGAPFGRIVLYIDDLDRCPAEKVVEVLQAVHLLLTFPLFVVVVAADIRWVSRALKRVHPELLDGEGDGRTATPYDYVEKIFQIPYQVRPMDGGTATKFLAHHGKALDEAPVPAVARPTTPTTPTTPGTPADPQPGPATQGARTEPDMTAGPAAGPGTGAQATRPPPDPPREAVREPPPAPPPPPDWLSLSDPERAFMAKLAPELGGSPRQLLRFLNVYRIVRGCLMPDQLEGFTAGAYRALMLHLAVGCVGGAPDEGFARRLSRAAKLADLASGTGGREDALLALYLADPGLPDEAALAALREWGVVARRFGFQA